MKIHSESRIAHPRQAVFEAYRDRLSEIADYIPDVKEIVVESRQEKGDQVVLHNVWISDRDIPSMATRFLKPEHLRWDDFATWHASEHYCEWRIKTRAFTEAVDCYGTNRFVEDGDGTRVILSGEFQIDLKSLPGVPSFLASRLAPKVESFIVSLITPNLERVNASLQQFLDEHPG